MNDTNIVIAIGRFTRDPELKYTQTGTALTSFSIAVNEKYKETEKVNYFDCVSFGKTAEIICQYCKKGARVAIDGKLSQERWETNEGDKRSKVVIKVDNIQFLSSKNDV